MSLADSLTLEMIHSIGKRYKEEYPLPKAHCGQHLYKLFHHRTLRYWDIASQFENWQPNHYQARDGWEFIAKFMREYGGFDILSGVYLETKLGCVVRPYIQNAFGNIYSQDQMIAALDQKLPHSYKI